MRPAFDGARGPLKALAGQPVTLELGYLLTELDPPELRSFARAAGELEVTMQGPDVCGVKVGTAIFVLREPEVLRSSFAGRGGGVLKVQIGPVQITIESLHASG